nr:LacI family DNA-binding transcriptional regulator [Microbacterium ulmi]
MGKGAQDSRPPSVSDVARLAGVSVSTAARVVRKDAIRVSPELVERVERAARTIGYAPNAMAQGLRRGRLMSVGLIVGDMLNPYFGEIAEAVTMEANARSMVAIVSNMQRDQDLEIQLARSLWEHRVSGLILASGSSGDRAHLVTFGRLIDQIQRSGTAVVALAPRESAIPTISVDNAAVGVLIAERLLALGHRRIGVVGGEARNLTYRERVAGLAGALARAGVAPVIVDTESSVEAGKLGAEAVLQQEPRTTAIVGTSDPLALGVAKRLVQLGRDVPREVSVVGIGNTLYASLNSPALTTVDVKLAEAGRAAVSYVLSESDPELPFEAPHFVPAFVDGGTLAVAPAAP